jgi:quercetin dioxygenase-like cupin family protein
MKSIHYQKVVEKLVDDPEARDVFIRLVIGPEDGAKNFHMRYFRVLPGGHTPHHEHPWEHENYVLAGKGEVMTPDGPRAVGPGDVVFIEAGMKHQYRNAGDTDFEFLCLIPAVGP